MIDVTKPLELEDGTPVKFINMQGRNSRIHVAIPSMPYGKGFTGRVFDLDGTHTYIKTDDGIKLKLRNVPMKLVDVNKPLIVGGKEAKVIHVFDNGNLAVIVDGRAEVQNYNKYGQANGEGCIILQNAPQVETRFMVIPKYRGHNALTYQNQENAQSALNNDTERFIASLKLTISDGKLTNVEIV